VKPLFPVVWEAFEDYRLGGQFLSRLDVAVIQRLTATGGSIPFSEEDFLAAQDPTWKDLGRSRERDECRAKLARLGMLRPDIT
jgi:thymidylate synthase (FAD)